jgi:hypothetical protein
MVCSSRLVIQNTILLVCEQPASRVHCSIAFGELVVNFPEIHVTNNIDSVVPVLIDILRDVPFIDFDKCLSWEGELVIL